MNNEIIKWNPKISNFPKTIYIEGLYDDYEGFRILVKGGDPSQMYKIVFDNYLGYRNFDEGERIKSFDSYPANSQEWCLFISKDSKFIDWVIDESEGFVSKDNVIHFHIITPNDVIEVLSYEEPKIEQL